MSRLSRFAVLTLAILTSTLSLAACGSSSTTAEAAPDTTAPEAVAVDVPVVTATVATIESSLEISGTLAPRSRVAVKSKVPGTIERIFVDIGNAVKIGETIATIDRREIDAQVDAATAAVAVAKAALDTADASLANAVIEHDRAKNLFDKGALPRQRLDAAETAQRAGTAQRELAAANLAQAQATLRRLKEVQKDTTVTSPVNGYIVERNYDSGAIPSDKPIVVVADLSEMKLEAGVSELEAGRLRTGMKALIAVQAKPGETFSGQLVAIAPEVDERNRHFKVDVRVPNSGRALLSGMYASARLVESTAANALVVPKEAVTTRNGKRIVQKVQGDIVSVVEITEGLSDGTRVQVVKGLSEGDTVLADGRKQLAAGQKVRGISQ